MQRLTIASICRSEYSKSSLRVVFLPAACPTNLPEPVLLGKPPVVPQMFFLAVFGLVPPTRIPSEKPWIHSGG